jgi:putative ABC transport system permease protein
MDNLKNDVRFALRTFIKRPGVALLSVITLSLGIGASTAMFSVVQSVLLKPLPYPEVDRLVSVYPGWPAMRDHPTAGEMAERGTWSWPEFFGVAENESVFELFAAYEGRGLTLTGDGPAQRVNGAHATWRLFPLLGANPVAGRLFTIEDSEESRITILSHGTWRDRFGGDPAAIGQSVILNDESFQIVGVLPPDFEISGVDAAFWLPRVGSFTDGGLGNHGGTRAVARLAPGVTLDQARDEVTGIFGSILPADHGEHIASIFPRQADETRSARPVILIMLAASALLLLVACGNTAALLVGAGIDREREFALRGAIGAPRSRIVSQLLVESSVLAVLSVGGGVIAASGLSRLMLYLAPTAVPGLDQASLDGTVLGFAVLTALIFGIGFGMIPALSVSKVDLASSMGSGRTTGKRARLQSALVVGEIGVACMLAVSGLLLTRTVAALDSVDPGLAYHELAAVAVAIPYQRFRSADGETDDAALRSYQLTLLSEIEAVPGVRSVAATSAPPFSSWRGNNNVLPEGWDRDAATPPMAERRFVTPGFFNTAGIELKEGRAFTADDAQPGAPWVIVISEGLASLGWPDGSALGSMMNYWGREATVVGVARNVRDESLEYATELAFYAPDVSGQLLVRAEGDPAALLPSIRERIWSFDEGLPVLVSSSVEDMVLESTAAQRYRARLMGVFAIMAALLALLGIYGVTSRSVSRRTREIGIRVALGAGQKSVWQMVSLQAIRLAFIGAVVGIVGARLMAGVIQSFLWGVSPGDGLTTVVVITAMPLFAVLAAVLPARRATRVDPLEALRAE